MVIMGARQLTATGLVGLPLVQPGDDLGAVLIQALKRTHIELQTRDVLVVAQKIVSKAEGRLVDLKTVAPSERARSIAAEVRKDPRLVEVILSESSEILRQKPDVLIVVHRLGFIMANAGVDQSNVGGPDSDQVLLLPQDPDGSAAALKERLDREFGADIGLIVNDSFGRPWRLGVVGVALGAAGLPAVRSMVGAPDLFGRALRVTEIAFADEVAAAASIVMGQGAEGLPAVHLRGLTWDEPSTTAAALLRPKGTDLFR